MDRGVSVPDQPSTASRADPCHAQRASRSSPAASHIHPATAVLEAQCRDPRPPAWRAVRPTRIHAYAPAAAAIEDGAAAQMTLIRKFINRCLSASEKGPLSGLASRVGGEQLSGDDDVGLPYRYGTRPNGQGSFRLMEWKAGSPGGGAETQQRKLQRQPAMMQTTLSSESSPASLT
ncbi:hypothetical protein Purlil1_9345 [Purpureocillium lilacinum]|uniref:Uncharacterized protein n=1 Tax=Purpureocillium lilacinum TaxID=33203 RepID=A0ABR0BQG4_PURLI|nr:hypothetical protein Purlil1_9345 [Purpureocillium lilacinum]